MRRTLLLITLIPFTVLSAAALFKHGYWGILLPHFQSLAAAQVLADLVIALSLVLVWMYHDARRTGRAFLPWLVVTLTCGSFGPLCYLLTARNHSART